MKLKNKKTGEIIETVIVDHGAEWKIRNMYTDEGIQTYNSLAELNAEWEDAPEEPKEYWYINASGDVNSICEDDENPEDTKVCIEIGNYFSSREEAEKAVEKLKAFKRLKDKGFRFKDYKRKFDGFRRVDGSVFIEAELDDEGTLGMINELSICFGGEDE